MIAEPLSAKKCLNTLMSSVGHKDPKPDNRSVCLSRGFFRGLVTVVPKCNRPRELPALHPVAQTSVLKCFMKTFLK